MVIKKDIGDNAVIVLTLFGSAWNGKADRHSNLNYAFNVLVYRDGILYQVAPEHVSSLQDVFISKLLMTSGRTLESIGSNPIRERPNQTFFIFPENEPLIRKALLKIIDENKKTGGAVQKRNDRAGSVQSTVKPAGDDTDFNAGAVVHEKLAKFTNHVER